MNTLQDRIRGSLIGGAIGDALGYPVEFIYSFEEIQKRYGEHGITRLDTKQHWLPEDEQVGKAVVSDDTQMTLFTANGLLNAKCKGKPGTIGIREAYIEWYLTQVGIWSNKYKDCWIARIPALNKRRGPGTTCMSSLWNIYRGLEPKNNSKGCGGVMRVAPIPLYAVVNRRIDIVGSDRLAAYAAEVTHQHPLGFISAALMAHIIYRLVLDEQPTRASLKQYIHEGAQQMRTFYQSFLKDILELETLIEKAVLLSFNDKSDLENIGTIGEGWTGDEALAIALYCSGRFY